MITRQGGVLRVDNALVENVFISNCSNGNILISHEVPGPNNLIFIDNLRLNINRNTAILSSRGLRLSLCDIREGMRIDSIFSPMMTRSIPPQSHAFLIVARRQPEPSASVTTDRIARVDANNNMLYTGNPNNINSQMRFIITNSTQISDRNGNPIPLRSLRPGQMVRITHANFQTLSIPPQTTAFHIQVL